MDVMKPCETCFNCGFKQNIDGDFITCICRFTGQKKHLWEDTCDKYTLKWFISSEQVESILAGAHEPNEVQKTKEEKLIEKMCSTSELKKTKKSLIKKMLDFFVKK